MKDWEFNVLDIYNYNKEGTKNLFFEFIKNNYNKLDGDIFEFGVYRGKSLLSIGLLLKELNSPKEVYGFDSFVGFPENSVTEKDCVDYFEYLFSIGCISSNHYNMVIKNNEYCKVMHKTTFNSNSGDFSNNNLKSVIDRGRFLDLYNSSIVSGSFSNTVPEFFASYRDKIMCVLLDCDLYNSYKTVLPVVWDYLVEGGMIYLDEYFSLKFPGARVACNEFFEDKKDKLVMLKREEDGFERWAAIK